MGQSTTRPAFLDPVKVTKEEAEATWQAYLEEKREAQYSTAPFPGAGKCHRWADCQGWVHPLDKDDRHGYCAACHIESLED